MNKNRPRAIKLNIDSNEYQRLLKEGQETVLMHSGLVTLLPGKSVGTHSTKDSEEIIIVLKGEGEMFFNGLDNVKMEEGLIIYCPPETEHDVKNLGDEPLKYIYVVAKVK